MVPLIINVIFAKATGSFFFYICVLAVTLTSLPSTWTTCTNVNLHKTNIIILYFVEKLQSVLWIFSHGLPAITKQNEHCMTKKHQRKLVRYIQWSINTCSCFDGQFFSWVLMWNILFESLHEKSVIRSINFQDDENYCDFFKGLYIHIVTISWRIIKYV